MRTHASGLTQGALARISGLTWKNRERWLHVRGRFQRQKREKGEVRRWLRYWARSLHVESKCLLRPRCCWHAGKVLVIPVGFSIAEWRNDQILRPFCSPPLSSIHPPLRPPNGNLTLTPMIEASHTEILLHEYERTRAERGRNPSGGSALSRYSSPHKGFSPAHSPQSPSRVSLEPMTDRCINEQMNKQKPSSLALFSKIEDPHVWPRSVSHDQGFDIKAME